MAKIIIEISEQEIKDLNRIRNHFGENDESMWSHMAYAVINDLIKKIKTEQNG